MMPKANFKYSVPKATERREWVSPLEEVLEESNVTELRGALLQTIERMQKNPALRVLIRKHGKARAVLMSTETYDALKRLAALVVEHADNMDAGDRMERAFQRLEEERPRKVEEAPPVVFLGPTVPETPQTDAKALVSEIESKLRELNHALDQTAAGGEIVA